MTEEFNINDVIQRYSLDEDEVAAALFPQVRYQKAALERIQSGKAKLDVEQLQALAKLAGVLIYDLFSIDTWKGASEDNCLVFIKGEYKVKLNYNGVFLSIYKAHKLIYQELALKNMSMTEFINYIDNIIKNNQNDGN